MANRGIPRGQFKHGLRTSRLILDGSGGAVQTPLHLTPQAEPTGSAAAGDVYFDTTAGTLMQYNGSAWEQVGSSPGVDLAVTGDVTIGDDLSLTSTGAILTMGPAGTNPVVLTQSADTLTLASGDTFAVTTADKLTVGGTIVPATQYASFRLDPNATVTEYDLMIAHRAITVTGIQVVPSTLQGGALTATICKCTGTAAPANGTTPMHTANAIDLNAGAYTVQTITLTGTAADLSLVAGQRIGIDYSGALTVGHAVVTIAYKYV